MDKWGRGGEQLWKRKREEGLLIRREGKGRKKKEGLGQGGIRRERKGQRRIVE